MNIKNADRLTKKLAEPGEDIYWILMTGYIYETWGITGENIKILDELSYLQHTEYLPYIWQWYEYAHPQEFYY